METAEVYFARRQAMLDAGTLPQIEETLAGGSKRHHTIEAFTYLVESHYPKKALTVERFWNEELNSSDYRVGYYRVYEDEHWQFGRWALTCTLSNLSMLLAKAVVEGTILSA